MSAERGYRNMARQPVFSHTRLLFTLAYHIEEFDEEMRSELATQMNEYLDEEILSRPTLESRISHTCRIPPNSFALVSKATLDYDESRVCEICKHVCIFTAVACECR